MNKIPLLAHTKAPLLAALFILWLSGCTLRAHIGARELDFQIGTRPLPQSTYTPEPTYTVQPTYTPLPTNTPLPTYTPRPSLTPRPTYTPLTGSVLAVTPSPAVAIIPTGPGEISQFASRATASSQYSLPSWSAMQAAGAPNTSACSDNPSAWASLKSNSIDWLLLSYDRPVIPTRIVIYQNYNPGAVSLVEVLDDAGNSITVYQAAPAIASRCPSQLAIEVKDVNTPVKTVRVTVDQSRHNGWNEIDAVQLIGRTGE
jgi:hypothetical protein